MCMWYGVWLAVCVVRCVQVVVCVWYGIWVLVLCGLWVVEYVCGVVWCEGCGVFVLRCVGWIW